MSELLIIAVIALAATVAIGLPLWAFVRDQHQFHDPYEPRPPEDES